MAAVILAIHGIVNTISTRVLAWIATFSAAWHFVGAMVLAVLIPCVAPTHQSASFVFLEFQGADVTASAPLSSCTTSLNNAVTCHKTAKSPCSKRHCKEGSLATWQH